MSRSILLGALALLILPACSGSNVVTRADLEAHVRGNPNDANALRELGVIYAQEHQYPRAEEYLERAFELRENDPRTLYHLGLVSEVLRKEKLALGLYERYGIVPVTSSYRDRLRGRYHWLLRRQLRAELREALAREDELTSLPAGDAVAVLPLTFRGGEPRYEPLGRGLAEMISGDLANVEQLSVVERVRTQVLLSEIEQARSGSVDMETAPRYGRLIRAGRLVGGQFNAADRTLRVEATVFEAQEEGLPEVATTEGRIDRLFEVQKEVVAQLLPALGVELAPEQHPLLAIIPTRSIDAILSFSRGLQAEDLDNLDQAARYYREAVRHDPGFTTAAQRAELVEAIRSQLGDATRMLSASAARPAVGTSGVSLSAPSAPAVGLGFLRHLIPRRRARDAQDRDEERENRMAQHVEEAPMQAGDGDLATTEPVLIAALAADEAHEAPEGLELAEATPYNAETMVGEPTIAETIDAEQGPTPRAAPLPVAARLPAGASLTVGYSNIGFDYVSAQRGYPYSFSGVARTVMFYGRLSSLSLAFGRDEAALIGRAGSAEGAEIRRTTLVDVALTTGGNVAVLEGAFPVPFQVFAPIRLNIDYRFLSSDEQDGPHDAVGAVHLPGVALGAGAGAWVRIPTAMPALEDKLVALGSLMFSYGGLNEIASGFEIENTRATRGVRFNTEVRAERILANTTGISLGYTYVANTWSDDYVSGLLESGDVGRWSDQLHGLPTRSRQHLVRIGINW